MDVDGLHECSFNPGLWSSQQIAFVNGFHFSFSDDHSRVRLQTLEGDNNSDYINGNYIDVCTLKLSISLPVLTQTTWCACHRTGGHMLFPFLKHLHQHCPLYHRILQWGFGHSFSQISLFAGNFSVTFSAFLPSHVNGDSENVISIFCQQLWLLKKKSVCILRGQNSLIPNSMICHLLSSLHF